VLVATLKQGYAAATGHIFRKRSSPVHLKTVSGGNRLGEVLDAVKRWPSSAGSGPWMASFDNYNMLKLLLHGEPDIFNIWPSIPAANHRAVLIMTQSSRLQTGRPVAVEQSSNMHNIDIDIDTYH
jgi:hypothetical protein